ncbi:putative nucleic-acid-binding protein [Neorhizobium alkalisoli]|uniref:Putative nucleic-acid-binding protein n=2 Tax=Neorhizobium alkalisoli TaxID=528178 RepID=A0A561QXA9_9HYPH|nr:putative nucleic-acid-binding protein [Neorhizobium alkalisoli]
MIGLDTNVVIRLLTDDDPQQRRAALRFAEGLGHSYAAFLTLIGIVELDWALRSRLGYSKKDSLSAIGQLLQTRGLIIEHHDLVVKAVRLASRENADLADALIAARSLDVGCKSIKTFDKKAATRVPGMELLA